MMNRRNDWVDRAGEHLRLRSRVELLPSVASINDVRDWRVQGAKEDVRSHPDADKHTERIL